MDILSKQGNKICERFVSGFICCAQDTVASTIHCPYDNKATGNLSLQGYSQKDTWKHRLQHTVELQWLEHLWDQENMFETGVVRANEC